VYDIALATSSVTLYLFGFYSNIQFGFLLCLLVISISSDTSSFGSSFSTSFSFFLDDSFFCSFLPLDSSLNARTVWTAFLNTLSTFFPFNADTSMYAAALISFLHFLSLFGCNRIYFTSARISFIFIS